MLMEFKSSEQGCSVDSAFLSLEWVGILHA